MAHLDIRGLRLCNQRIEEPPLEKPEDVVGWMTAVQSQDYAQAAWALGLRAQHATAADIDRALAEGSILRTHVLRPTWHFVSPRDIRWLLALTGPRIKAGSAHRYRELQLDDALLGRTNELLARALEGVFLTRDELGEVLADAGIDTIMPQRLVYILMTAELDGVICSGPRRGRQFTYALLDERAPRGRVMARDEAVVELVRRYFTSHGPATMRDFAWWSGLTIGDARAGIDGLGGELVSERVDGRAYWLRLDDPLSAESRQTIHLLPAFDEYTVAYADRRDVLLPEHSPQTSTVMLGPVIVAGGRVVGSWRRTIKKDVVVVEPSPFTILSEAEQRGLTTPAVRYAEFLGLPAQLR